MAWILVLAGIAVAVRGIRRQAPGLGRPVTDAAKGAALLRAFRAVVVGLTLIGLGLAWEWQLGWLLGLTLVIGGEELLESTVVIAALDAGGHPPLAPAPRLGTRLG
jgi:hypothetical protein